MGTYGSAVTSWRMISSGKMGANASGPTGFLVAGLRGGSNWKGKSGTMLYQLSGNDLSSSRNFVDSIPGLLFCRQLTISLQALASKGRPSQPPRQVSGPQRYRRADLPIISVGSLIPLYGLLSYGIARRRGLHGLSQARVRRRRRRSRTRVRDSDLSVLWGPLWPRFPDE